MPEGSHVLAIAGLAVATSTRRRGVAAALLTAAETSARERGARKIALHVFAPNVAARQLYERFGYAVEGVHPREFVVAGRYVDDVSMAKWLGDESDEG